MYVLMTVMLVLFPVRTLIDCISVVLSCGGRRDFVYALVSVYVTSVPISSKI